MSRQQSYKIGDYIYYAPAIGKGSFSKVYVGYKIGHRRMRVAIKKISHTKKINIHKVQREVELLKSFDHPNIVKFYDAITDNANNIYIITEYCNFDNLSKYTEMSTNPDMYLFECDIKCLLEQLRDGLHYLVSRNILHRDIKPENILLHQVDGDVIVKIADFGLAKHFDTIDLTATLCGTPKYLSLEILKERKYTIVSDIWSIGIILYQLFYHRTPFVMPDNQLQLMKNIENMRLVFDTRVDMSVEARDMLTSMLEIDPHKRMSWGNFFANEWFDRECAREDIYSHENKDDDTKDDDLCEKNKNPLEKEKVLSSSDELDISGDEEGILLHIKKKMSLPQPIRSTQAPIEFLRQTSELFSDIKFIHEYRPNDHLISCHSTSVPTEIQTKLPTPSLPWRSPILGALMGSAEFASKMMTSGVSYLTESVNRLKL